MEFLTQLIDRPVLDSKGERFGKLAEVIVSPADPLPVVSAYQIKTEDGAVFVPAAMLRTGTEMREFELVRPYAQITPYKIEETDFSLVRDVLDKQIVDVHDFRVVRVSDIRLQPLGDGRIALLGVDPGVRALVRRLGLGGALGGITKMLHLKQPPEEFIAWNDVESLPTHNAGEPLKLKVSHEKIARLHPADIGDILNQLDPADRKEIVESLDIETAAEALAEADDQVQVDIIKQLDEEHAADILEEMPADEAADVLGDMDNFRRQDLLGRMDANDRDNVTELLEYEDETAGGLMTNEYVAIPQELTAQETIDKLRALEPEAETIYYVYVVDSREHLVGVISLRDLIVAKPDQPVSEFMIQGVKSIHVDANVNDVAHKFERYKLLAIPVVDDDGELQGIVTIDDTLETMLPPDWRRRSYNRSKRQPAEAGA